MYNNILKNVLTILAQVKIINKHMKREFLGYLLYQIGRWFTKKEKFLSLYFHAPTPIQFEQIINWCKKSGYRFIDINECYNILSKKNEIREKVVYFSFDDGWNSNLDLLPIVEKYNVPITIFVATEPIDSGNYWWEYAGKAGGANKISLMKKLEQEEFIKELSILKSNIEMPRSSITEKELAILVKHPLVSIQSHTVTHPILINCSQDALDKELVESKKYLEEKTGEEIYAFSYPNGDVGDREVESVEKAGYKIAFTTKPTVIDTTNPGNLFLIPRKAINTNGGKYENLAKIIGVWQKFFKHIKKFK